MSRLHSLLFRLQPLFRRKRIEAGLNEEIKLHLDLLTEKYRASGLSPGEARRAALREFGGVEQIKEAYRDQRSLPWLEDLLQDLRLALRQLRRTPVFAAIAVLSLALGIGANTAIFSLVNAILLRSLPVPNPQELRLVTWAGVETKIRSFSGSINRGVLLSGGVGAGATSAQRDIADSVSYPLYSSLSESCSGEAELFCFSSVNDVTVQAMREAFTGEGLMVSGNFFSSLRIRPFLGRLLGAEDANPGAALSVVISQAWWEKHYDRDPAVLGRSLTLNGAVFTIVGVLPREFPGLSQAADTQFYVTVAAQPQLKPGFPLSSPNHWWLQLMVRLKPGIPEAQFQTSLDLAFGRESVSFMKEPKVVLADGRGGLRFNRNFLRKPLLLMQGVVGLVILVACANLAGLSLARGEARQHEFAVRSALGAGRWRLVRQSLSESLLLALMGAGMGVLLALWAKGALSRLLSGSPDGLRYDLSLDAQVLGFTLLTALLAALLSGLLPALRAGQADPSAGLREQNAKGRPRLRIGRLLVATQICLSVLLLVGAGLFARSLSNLVHINAGFTTEKLLLFELNPRAAGYRGARTSAFFEQAETELAKIPGVTSVTFTQFTLLKGMMSNASISRPGNPAGSGERMSIYRLTVGDRFFDTMGIPITRGRGLSPADTDGSLKVIVVNETFVRTYLGKEHPIGLMLDVNNADRQIVGVCADAKYENIKSPIPPTVYFSYRQNATGFATFALRTTVPPLSLAPAARRAMAALDPRVPLAKITTQEAVRDQSISQERLFALLCGSLAAMTVLLSCIGLYGLMAYSVTRRTMEIGVRMALGASPAEVAWPILADACLLAFLGLAAGLPLAVLLAELIRSQLYGVAPSDPLTLATGGALLLLTALLAAWVPARRASRVDPITALRTE